MLKKSQVGFEVEMFTIDDKGFIVNKADNLLEKFSNSKKITIKKECAKNIIEIASYPDMNIKNTMGNLLKELEILVPLAEKEGISFYPLGTYPGKFQPSMRDDTKYDFKKRLFGKERFKIAGRCVGFHCHYTLPTGIFDTELRVLKMIVRSKIKDSFVNSYNMLIAADPALSCFMQSSPYYQGRFIGKDSRVIMYRGGKPFNNKTGLYAKFQEFGGLPQYRLTNLDIMDMISNRYEEWKTKLMRIGINIQALTLYQSILDTSWNPIKVNAKGTLEQRGVDMNHPTLIIGMGVLMKYLLKNLQEEFYSVIPSEIAIKEPFKVEGDVIYIPPLSHVRDNLQRISAVDGLENEEMHRYCKRFLRFVDNNIPKDKKRLMIPFKKMIEDKKTISDEILQYTKKQGYAKGEPIPDTLAAKIALLHSKRFLKEIELSRQIVSKLA
jgi:hypothetical protein